MPNDSNCQIPTPLLLEGSHQDLRLESILRELPLYEFQVELSCLGTAVAAVFEQHPLLPGAILVDQGQFVSLISRQQLLEYLLRPQGLELFLNKPLRVLHSYARTDSLILPDDMPVVRAARLALRRPPSLQGEPIVVRQEAQTYRLLNIYELNIAYWQIRGIETQVRFEHIQAQMIQSEKMAGLGRLVDGVAHEILDPVGFIWGNLSHISTYTQNLLDLVDAYQQHFPELPAEIMQIQEDIELDYLQKDLPHAITSIRAGAERLKKLTSSLQNFCHIDEVYPKPADINTCIDSVLLLLKSRLSGEIEVIQHYGHLPPVPCYAGQLSQVFMNILSNAIDALINQSLHQKFAREFRDHNSTFLALERTDKPQITISTEICSLSNQEPDALTPRGILIRIADNGPGMSPQKQRKLLDSFQSEKRAEKETSLALSYWIVTAKHGGQFRINSQLHAGTTFEIVLPLA